MLRAFFGESEDRRRQDRPKFDPAIWRAPDVQKALSSVFSNKCAYCESWLGITSSFEVEMFRPKCQVIGSDGKTRLDGYWWLAYEWSNLYIACQACNRAKGPRFPIQGEPAKPFSDAASLLNEKPLLLDPCFDDPD